MTQVDDERSFTSPEAVELRVRLAEPAARVGALCVDFGIICAVISVVEVVLLAPIQSRAFREILLPTAVLSSFLIRTAYFTLFECIWNGQTPGKRLAGVRVISRNGEPLGIRSIVARNAMREVELFVPLSYYLLTFHCMITDLGHRSAPSAVLGLIWSGLFTLLPLFNSETARAGDFVAGTWVIEVPRPVLLPDLLERQGNSAEPSLDFTPAQLDMYGKHELRFLGDVLRGDVPADDEILEEIARRIKRKIRWRGRQVDPATFLSEFYAAQRAHLERGMLVGQARERKRD